MALLLNKHVDVRLEWLLFSDDHDEDDDTQDECTYVYIHVAVFRAVCLVCRRRECHGLVGRRGGGVIRIASWYFYANKHTIKKRTVTRWAVRQTSSVYVC